MAKGSAIEWTDNSVPVVTGCTKKGAGCKHCYAIPLAWRLAHHPHPDIARRYEATVHKRPDGTLAWTGRINFNLDQLDAIQRARRPQTWFLSHMGDLFHDAVPATVVDAVLAVAALKPEQRLILLTKRPERAAELLAGPKPLPNVWVGASVAHDRDADNAAGPLRELAADGWPTLVSYEPALGPVDWAAHDFAFLRWIISGGESGQHARPTHPDWHRATRDFCQRHWIAYFFKQWGEWVPCEMAPRGTDTSVVTSSGELLSGSSVLDHSDDRNAEIICRVGKRAAGHLLDGQAWQQVPWAEAA